MLNVTDIRKCVRFSQETAEVPTYAAYEYKRVRNVTHIYRSQSKNML
jgi:hypothetical protein